MDMNTIDFKGTVDTDEGFDLIDGRVNVVLFLNYSQLEELVKRSRIVDNNRVYFDDDCFVFYADVAQNGSVSVSFMVLREIKYRNYYQEFIKDVPLKDEEKAVLLSEIEQAARENDTTLELLLSKAAEGMKQENKGKSSEVVER